MNQFTFSELGLLHMSLHTRIQRVEFLLQDFTSANDTELFNLYNTELQELQELEIKITKIRFDEINK